MSLPQQKYVLDVRNPFTRADARAAGITVKELISSRYQKVFYSLYVSALWLSRRRFAPEQHYGSGVPTAMQATTPLPSYGASRFPTMTAHT